MTEIINYISSDHYKSQGTPNYLSGLVDLFSESLDSYALAGGDPVDLPLGVRASEVLATAVIDLLNSDYHMKPFVDTEWLMDTIGAAVMNIAAITESLDEGSYGVDLCDRFNAFMVEVEQLEDTF